MEVETISIDEETNPYDDEQVRTTYVANFPQHSQLAAIINLRICPQVPGLKSVKMELDEDQNNNYEEDTSSLPIKGGNSLEVSKNMSLLTLNRRVKAKLQVNRGTAECL